jgi:hypothetical protein
MTKPSSMRVAKKWGWHIVTIKRVPESDRSWLGLLMRVDRLTAGPYVSEYNGYGGGKLAFKQEGDAALMLLKYGKTG